MQIEGSAVGVVGAEVFGVAHAVVPPLSAQARGARGAGGSAAAAAVGPR
jgi:hypothetical protein